MHRKAELVKNKENRELFITSQRHPNMQTEILIVGAGAIGAFYASRLAHAKDVHVSVVCRSNYSVVSKNGFQITSHQYGAYNFTPSHVFSSPAEASSKGISWDFIFVSTKALPDVTDDSVILEGLVDKTTAIVLVQNGLGVETPYARRFPHTIILSGVTIASVAQPQHGMIKYNRWTRITLGPYLPDLDARDLAAENYSNSRLGRDHEATKLNDRIVGWLREGGINDAEMVDHATLQLIRWHKIAINAAMNPSSVLSGGTTNEAMSKDHELEQHLKGVMNEVLETAPKVLGVQWPTGKKFASAEQILASTRKNSSGSVPSMQIDWQEGKKLELEVILGEPLRQARDKGLDMPRLQSCYALLKMAQTNRDVGREGSKL